MSFSFRSLVVNTCNMTVNVLDNKVLPRAEAIDKFVAEKTPVVKQAVSKSVDALHDAGDSYMNAVGKLADKAINMKRAYDDKKIISNPKFAENFSNELGGVILEGIMSGKLVIKDNTVVSK